MESYLHAGHYDLVTPDGKITSIQKRCENSLRLHCLIEDISPTFRGFSIDEEYIFFNIKSTLAQLGLHSHLYGIDMDKVNKKVLLDLEMQAIGVLARELLKLLDLGCYIGKLFAADPSRRVRDPSYLSRMFGRSDRWGDPLLSLGGLQGSNQLILEKVDGRTIAHLNILEGNLVYRDSIHGFLPTLASALKEKKLSVRRFLSLHQTWVERTPNSIKKDEILLVKTLPLHIRTVFAKVVPEQLPQGYEHTSASILQPDTKASGDIYELFGESKQSLVFIPLEFYTLEAHREHVFFVDRDQLQSSIEDAQTLFKTFSTAPALDNHQASVFIVKARQLFNLTEKDWVVRESNPHAFPGVSHELRQARLVDRYIQSHSAYPFLRSIEDGLITSQGILLTRYFPSPLLKRMLLSDQVQRLLKGIYFQTPSLRYGQFLTQEDRALLHDLHTFAVPVFWVDEHSGRILRYIERKSTDSGMFVPLDKISTFLNATAFGIYGSNLQEGSFERELILLLEGVLAMRGEVSHPYLSKNTHVILVTGGGPGAMEVGNRVARKLDILSCANIVDFSGQGKTTVNEQSINSYIEGKMTYNLRRLVERQAEFHLDFPIFLPGGIGTDFEYCLEEVRRKVGTDSPTPMILFGDNSYWREKITTRFQANVKSGANAGSEWLSNCFYCIQNAEQGLNIYRKFFEEKLDIGPKGPIYEKGFVESDQRL